MWNRRDCIVLAAAAVATFGLTLTAFYPRLAGAVDLVPIATTNVKTPTLDLGTATVSAALDPADPQTILFTVQNATDDPARVEFLAVVMETPPTSEDSRRAPSAQPVWSQELSVDLQAGETLTIRRTLAALPRTAPSSQVQASQGKAVRTVPASRFLTLSAKDQPARRINALSLSTPDAAPKAAS
jgi:hypothetical protein